MQGLSLIIPFTCQQPLNLGHEQLEPLQNVYRMGTCGTGFLVLTRSVLGSFKSWRMFLSGAGCIYVLGCWEDGKGVGTILRLKCHQVTYSLWTNSPCSLRSRPADLLFYTRSFSSSGFTSCFMVSLVPLVLLLVYSCTILVCWHRTSHESTAIILIAKMLTAATEIPVAMDVIPGVAAESPTGKNL